MKRIYYSIVFRFHIIGVQVTIGRLGKYLGTKSRQQQLAESGLLEKNLYIMLGKLQSLFQKYSFLTRLPCLGLVYCHIFLSEKC